MYFLKWQTVLTEKAEEAPPAEETDAQPVKRAAEEDEVGVVGSLVFSYVLTNLVIS